MRVLLWLSGEHPTMPKAEALAAFAADGPGSRLVQERRRLLVLESGVDEPSTRALVERLGLTHDASGFLAESHWDPERLEAAIATIDLPAGTRFAVRAERVSDSGPRRTTVERDVGAVLAHGRTVELEKPDLVVRCFIDGDYVWIGRLLWDRDPKDTAARHVKQRPVGSPVSLPPKTARALLNLARVPRGSVVYDPFCGTGGVLLEGASMGLEVVGSDLDPRMVDASRTNLAHYGLRAADLFESDIGDAPKVLRERGSPSVAAVVTDFPYGRSASTGKEEIRSLYDRGFEAIRECLPRGGRAVIGLPSEASARRSQDFFEPIDLFKVWVHRSLTRHFVVLRRR